MKIEVRNLDNKPVKEIELPEAVFGYPYKEHLIHEAVRAWLAARRRGTHKVKDRSEVSGSGRKLWRQKGTGRARVGDIRTPKWRKGGIVHGPQVRSHATRMSAGEKKSALKSALSRKIRDEGVLVLESLELDSHKTRDLAGRLAHLGIDGKALLVDSLDNVNLGRAARNNPKVKTVDPLGVNVYDVVDRPYIVLSEGALERLVEVLTR